MMVFAPKIYIIQTAQKSTISFFGKYVKKLLKLFSSNFSKFIQISNLIVFFILNYIFVEIKSDMPATIYVPCAAQRKWQLADNHHSGKWRFCVAVAGWPVKLD